MTGISLRHRPAFHLEQVARMVSRGLLMMVTIALVASGLTGLIGAVAPGVAAAVNPSVTWSIQQSYPAPALGFGSVSCSTSNDCFAVGDSIEAVSGPVLYETNNGGSTWENDTASIPSGVSGLSGVSCVSASFCEAVGSGALSWNGSTWTSQTIPSRSALDSVSCLSTNFCEAVGYNSPYSGAALSWNGTIWTSQSIPSGVGKLNSVSCLSTNFCEAVGSGNWVSVALSWNGTTWTSRSLPSDVVQPNGVSCVSANSCEAVGDYYNSSGSGSVGVALSWNGTIWTSQSIPSSVTGLDAVLCLSTSFCEAMGYSSSDSQVGVALSWNGTIWTSQSIPSGVGKLNSVSCLSTNFCEAVGSGNWVGVALSWNGTTWTSQTLPSGSDVSGLNGVSCVSASFCEVVGYSSYSYSRSSIGVALSWNGTIWTSQTLPSDVVQPNGVSCVSASFCEAVGSGALSWNGSTWTSQTLPSNVDWLNGVSCVSASFCEAVGGISVALSWNGTTWTSQSIPSSVTGLDALSCLSTNFCEAVGYVLSTSPSGSTGVALSWNGTSWTSQSLPSTVGELNGVSCLSTNFCEAVGASTGNTGVALSWNGMTWTSQSLPSNVDWPNGVSCVSASFCEAVGEDSSYSGVALSWNGTTWTSQSLPSTVGELNGVSCLSTNFCEAVGGSSDNSVILTTALTITSITPNSSPLAGGGTATIIGTNFAPGAAVMFGSITATTTTVVSSDEITVTIPPGSSPGLVEVTVTISGVTSAGSGFIYVTNGIPYTPVTPYRIADTRCSAIQQPLFCSQENLPSANQSLSSPPAGGSITVQVTGTGTGSNTVPTDAQSVIVTVTAIAGTTAHSGYLTVYPTGTNPPEASSLNYTPGIAIPNLVTATLGKGGAIDILSSSPDVNIVVDVEGYYEPSTSSSTNEFTPLPLPIRVLDTRCSTNPQPTFCSSENLPKTNQISAPTANGYIKVQITGDGGSSGIPVTATAVSLVVTAAGSTKGGFLTVFPAGSSTTPPETSNVNFHANISSADSVTVALGSSGAIYIYNSASAPTNVIVDINGYFSSTGDLLTPSSPVRICDTRSPTSIGGSDVASNVSGQCNNSGKPLNPSSDPITVQVTGIAGIPTTAKVVVANITVVNTTDSGYLTAWAAGATRPATSNINWGKGQVMPNMVISALNSNGQMEIYTFSTANVIIDVVGWYS